MENILVNAFATLFERELGKLEAEIGHYAEENTLWKVAGQVANSPGNLCLHLCGNLQIYIGATLGKTGYIRDRPYEFSAKDLSREHLLSEICKTRTSLSSTFKKLSDADLLQQYPDEVLGYPMTSVFFLNHLLAHFGYHLGQINYHRRLITAVA
jgi:hypothetical protein